MEDDLETLVLEILLARIPNWVSEQMVRSRVGYATPDEVTQALADLVAAGDVETEIDPTGIIYYRLMRREGLPVRRTVKIGDREIPRLLENSSPKFLPEHFNDAMEQLAELSTTLEQRFKRLVAEEQRRYWANVVGIFSILVSVLALILTSLPKIVSDPNLPFGAALLMNLSQILPLALVLTVLVVALRWIVR